MISLCSKMYCASDFTEEKIKFSCKGIQKDGNNVNYQKFHDVLFNGKKDMVLNKGMRYINGTMKSYEQEKKGLSYAYHKRIVQNDGIMYLIFVIKLNDVAKKVIMGVAVYNQKRLKKKDLLH